MTRPGAPAAGVDATVADVAALAGVARSSVSRVLAGHPNVSTGLRDRVLKAAAQLGYSPDPNAASLRSGRTRSVGTVVRDLASPLYAPMLHGAEVELRAHGYSTLVANSDGDPELGLQHIGGFGRRRVDGLLLSPESDSSDFTRRVLAASKVPMVLLDRDVPDELIGERLGAVHCDHYEGCRMAMEQVLAAGHRRIAFFGGPLSIRPTRERLRSYLDALREAEIPHAPELVVTGSHAAAFGHEQALRALSGPQRPDAFFSGGVEIAVGVLLALASLPAVERREIAVISCDDMPLMALADVPLVVVDRDREAIGAQAALQLLQMLDGGAPGTVQSLPTFVRAARTFEQ